MANDLPRLMLFDHEDTFIRDLDPDSVWRAYTIYEVNGEHSLTIETTDELAEGDRIVWRDGMLLWHEHVVTGQVSERNVGGVVVHSYWCAWSLQYDLANTFVSAMPGTVTPVGPRAALEAALGGTSRWTVGTVSQGGTNGTSMFRMSGWEAMQELVEAWGGEVSATITVGASGVTSRQVNLLAHEGNETPTRRFDYAGDLSGIKRTLPEQPWAARVIPLGKAQQTEGGGYGRRTTIESVNGGVMWLQNASVVPYVRVPDGQGGWEVPVRKVETDAYDDPAALKAWAEDHLEEWTTPQASYEADVVQLTRAGLDAQGVALGDEIVVVDHTFGPSGIAIQGRALRIEEDLRDPAQTRITVSALRDTLGDELDGLARQVNTLSRHSADTSEYQATAAYLSALLARINGEANLTGGYAYITEGQGIRTYDRPVTDPLVGAEATKVVEIKGGTIRIADSRTSGGDWDWRTVFVAGHIAAELVTAAQITAGYIGSAESGNYWDLDSGELNINNGSIRLTMDGYRQGSKFIAELANFTTTSFVLNPEGSEETYKGLHMYTTNDFRNDDVYLLITQTISGSTTAGARRSAALVSTGSLILAPAINDVNNVGHIDLYHETGNFGIVGGRANSYKTHTYTQGGTLYHAYAPPSGSYSTQLFVTGGTSATTTHLKVFGKFTATGTKSRLVDTDHYNDRLLYCDETPSPTFTDFGSGRTDEDGLCYVEVDDVFAETARTDMAYQVFLQACGKGELWVEEKTPSYFVVHGTPNLAFDWQLKAHQKGYELERMETQSMETMANEDVELTFGAAVAESYSYELNYTNEMEALYEMETTK